MKAFLWQFVLSIILILIVLNVAEAPKGFVLHEQGEEAREEITLAFVGDVMLGRNVEVLMGAYGRDYTFASTSEIFDKADFVIANLEGPIPANHLRTSAGEMSFSFPQFVPEVLRRNGIDAVSLANNHTYDKGPNVYAETMYGLQVAHLSTFGHPTIENASYSQNYLVHGIPFTLVGFNSTFPSFDLNEAKQTIQEVKAMFPEGMIIVFMHWGDEYELSSNNQQKEISQALQNAGANLVIGAHPHVTQEVSCKGIERCTIFSLGNFIFDQYFSKDVEEGLVAYVTISQDSIKKIELLPIEGNHSKPAIMRQNKEFLAALLARSSLQDITLSTSTGSVLIQP